MAVRPRLADVQCTRMQFQPGDRVLVRVRNVLDREAKKKLRKSVQRWAGDHVEVLIVELPLLDIERLKADDTDISA